MCVFIGGRVALAASDLALRLFSTTCSLACLPLIAGISDQVAGRKAALSACALFAFSPLSIFYSTEGRMYGLLWLCVLAVILGIARIAPQVAA